MVRRPRDQRRRGARARPGLLRRRAHRQGQDRRRRARLRRGELGAGGRAARAAEAWAAMVKKYVNPRIAPHTDESARLRDIGIFGPNARHIVAAITGVQSPALTALRAVRARHAWRSTAARVLVARVPELGVDGFELIVPAEIVRRRSGRRAVDAGAAPAGLDAWEIARVEAGRPEWGLDIDDTTIPQEANFDELARDLVHEGMLRRTGDGGARALPRTRQPASARHSRARRGAAAARRHAARRRWRAGGRRAHGGSVADAGRHRAGDDPPRSSAWRRARGAMARRRVPTDDRAGQIERRVDVAALPFAIQ